MKFVDEFQDKEIAQGLIKEIENLSLRDVTIMEVCGTHTMEIGRFGIRSLLPQEVRVIAGPGCPVCVAPQKVIDQAIKLAEVATIVTYGDMYRVPGSYSSLQKEKAKGRDIRVVYSALDALQIAEKETEKEIVFLAIGFETTVPATGSLMLTAKRKEIHNFSILCAHRLIPPAMIALSDGELNVDGYLCPGHVSVIIGEKPYEPIAERFHIPCVIAGFEPIDILMGIYLLLGQIKDNRAEVENGYKRAVRPEGNLEAQALIARVFRTVDSEWRGLGELPASGLALREEFKEFDAEQKFNIEIELPKENPDCICGEILKGLRTPPECTNFGRICTPDEPIGPCMVSSEGTCAAYYKYQLRRL
ncbi:hydrogenase formation protein HypD [candidate division WOR-3 bacterium]|nr:hydrogenase formation protein HypD [candidate division WOR-3 bacterium]